MAPAIAQCMIANALLQADRGAEHIMAMPAVKRRWTLREVRQLIDESPLATPRYELVDGELLVTPSPNWPHQSAVSLLLLALMKYLERQPVGRAATSPFDVELAPESLVQPDIFVLPRGEARRLLTEMPARELLLAVEVLSPSSGRHDRVRKRPHYQRHVPEYWIVDLDARLIERWRPADERPEILADALEWAPPGSTEPLRLDLTRYFAEVLDEA
jgi:Uma2 family endonuclease